MSQQQQQPTSDFASQQHTNELLASLGALQQQQQQSSAFSGGGTGSTRHQPLQRSWNEIKKYTKEVIETDGWRYGAPEKYFSV